MDPVLILVITVGVLAIMLMRLTPALAVIIPMLALGFVIFPLGLIGGLNLLGFEVPFTWLTWFGAVVLRLSLGHYQFSLNSQ